jgi:hypothetical protein
LPYQERTQGRVPETARATLAHPLTAAEELLEIIMRRYERAGTFSDLQPSCRRLGKLLGDAAAVIAMLDRLLIIDQDEGVFLEFLYASGIRPESSGFWANHFACRKFGIATF